VTGHVDMAGRAGGARGRRPRGAALLVVMVAVALVTAVAVELAYQTRVSLRIAGNARDELRALALARGSVGLGRLVLHFQARLDETAGQVSGRTAALIGTLGGAAAATQPPAVPRPQIWRLVPVDSTLATNLFGGGGWAADAPPEGQGPAPGAGLPDGTFTAVLDDEDRKVNVQLENTPSRQADLLPNFLALVGDRRWDFLFEREDAGGQRTSRTDLAVHLRDWTDDNQVQSAVTGLPTRPFEDGFGDENFAYDRGPDRYKAKNARFDSLDELFLVTGVSDAFMAAFGDQLTVYLSQNAKLNVNADTAPELLRNALIMAEPAGQPILSDPTFAERLQKSVRQLSQNGWLSISPLQFAQLLESMGLAVNPVYLQPTNKDQRGGFTDRSRVFRVRGQAKVGAVEKSIEAVVTFDPEQAREQAGQLGRLLHWREE